LIAKIVGLPSGRDRLMGLLVVEAASFKKIQKYFDVEVSPEYPGVSLL